MQGFEGFINDYNPASKAVIDFFRVFSRFEYALKAAGYLRNGKWTDPDWDAFAKQLSDYFGESKPSVTEAKAYLINNPPQKQFKTKVGEEFTVEFKPFDLKNDISETEVLTQLIKTVRNNLFHGGKFTADSNRVDSARDQALLKHSLTVLKAFLEAAAHSENPKLMRVQEAFFDATPSIK